MYQNVFFALLATLGTWLVTALGAATVVLFRSPKTGVMNLMLGFASGVMIAASYWSLLAPAIESAEALGGLPPYVIVTMGFLCGAVFMWMTDKAVNHVRYSAEPRNTKTEGRNRTLMLILAITLHNIPEGLAVGVAFGMLGEGDTREALMGAITIAVGIGLQNFPEGAAVALPLLREGYTKRRSFLAGQASGMVEPLAGILGAALVVCVRTCLPFLLSFAAGAMILVAVHELIPECQKDRETQPYLATVGIVSGFATMMLLDVALG